MAGKKTQDCCPTTQVKRSPLKRSLDADDELALLTKALGHPARVQILRILTRRQTCICGDLVEAIDLAQSTVSQHLKVLKAAQLIRGDIEGTSTCYCIDPRGLRRLKTLVAGL